MHRRAACMLHSTWSTLLGRIPTAAAPSPGSTSATERARAAGRPARWGLATTHRRAGGPGGNARVPATLREAPAGSECGGP